MYDDRCGFSMDFDTFSRLMDISNICVTEDHQRFVHNAFWGSQFMPNMQWELPSITFTEFSEAVQYLISRTVEGSR
jgi:hypothetical protein